MGRHKKYSSVELVQIVDEFFAEKVNGDPSALKCSRIAEYARKKGHTIEAHNFRRDETVRRRIEELKDSLSVSRFENGVPAHKSLDIDGMLSQCVSLEQLKRQLYEMDSYWKANYDEFAGISFKYQQLILERSHEREEYELLKKKAEALQEQLDETLSQVQRLTRENVYLRKMLRENLYPSVAGEILRRRTDLPVPDNTTVKPEAMDSMIESGIPLPFDGVQGKVKEPKSRCQRLLEDLERQVDKNG